MPDGKATARSGPGGRPGSGGAFISAPGVPPTPNPLEATSVQRLISTPISETFNIGGAPIAILGGVFSGGLPLAGPVTQIFRGGSAPMPPTLFIATVSPGGPIATFLIGSGGAPIGVDVFQGGALPIGEPPKLQQQVEQIQPRTALVGPPAVALGSASARGPTL